MPSKSKRNRVWTYGSGSVLSTLFFIGIVVFIALIAHRHPWRLDLTETGAYSLSEQSRNVLKSMEQPVAVKAFFATASPEQSKAKDLLDTYRYQTDKISYEFIDPDRQPDLARRYEIRSYGTMVLEGYDKKQTIQTVDEESLTNAIFKLSRNEEKKIYFLSGHGERSSADTGKDGYSTAREALEKENYTPADLSLLQQERVPEDAAVIIVAGPQKPIFEQEVKVLKSYVESGGKLMVLLDPFHDGGLRDFLKSHGVELSDDIVIDKLSRVFGGSYLMPVVTQYGPHRITENFNVVTFYSEARSVQPMKEPPENVHLETLASTSENAWAERNLDLVNQGQANLDDNEDMAGPVPLLVLAQVGGEEGAVQPDAGKNPQDSNEKNASKGSKEGLLLVGGDSDFVSNTHFALSGNGDLFLNMVNFLAEEENLITIEPRGNGSRPVLLTQNQARMIFWTVLVLVPLVVVLSGLAVYRVRRSQR